MKLILPVFAVVLGSLSAHAADERCLAKFQKYVDSKIELGVPEKHLPKIYLPEKENGKVAVFIHGMFESPYFYKGIANTLRDRGYIVVAPLLSGHWEANWSNFDRVSYRDWLRDSRAAIDVARCLSPYILLGGHSTGGLLAIHEAVQNPDHVTGLMLWSPAVQLGNMAYFGGLVGRAFGLSGNTFKWSKPDHDETTYYSPNSAVQLQKLLDFVRIADGKGKMVNIYKRLTMPTFLAYAEDDPVIPVADQTLAGYQITGIRDVMFFNKATKIWHEGVAKFPEDAYKAKPWDINTHWVEMKDRMEKFLNGILFK